MNEPAESSPPGSFEKARGVLRSACTGCSSDPCICATEFGAGGPSTGNAPEVRRDVGANRPNPVPDEVAALHPDAAAAAREWLNKRPLYQRCAGDVASLTALLESREAAARREVEAGKVADALETVGRNLVERAERAEAEVEKLTKIIEERGLQFQDAQNHVLAERDANRERVKVLEEALRSVQWGPEPVSDTSVCPWCLCSQCVGHAPDCVVGRALSGEGGPG